jgi:hypothetical protein
MSVPQHADLKNISIHATTKHQIANVIYLSVQIYAPNAQLLVNVTNGIAQPCLYAYLSSQNVPRITTK